MKRSRLLFSLAFILICSLALTSCSGKEGVREIIIDVEMEGFLIENARNQYRPQFAEIMEATKKIHSKKGGDFVELFFDQAELLFPKERWVEYFEHRDLEKLDLRSSNKDVRSYFKDESEICMDIVNEIINSRLKNEGVESIQVIRGKNKISLVIQSELTKEELAEFIEIRGSLEFYELHNMDEMKFVWQNILSLSNLRAKKDSELMKSVQIDGEFWFVPTKSKKSVEAFLRKKEVKAITSISLLRFMFGNKETKSLSTGKKGYYLYPVKVPINGKANVRGKHIIDAWVGSGFQDHKLSSIIKVRMSEEASGQWQQMTTNNIGKYLAIVTEREVISTLNCDEPITDNWTEFFVSYSDEEAKNMTRLIRSGTLPVRCKIKKVRKL